MPPSTSQRFHEDAVPCVPEQISVKQCKRWGKVLQVLEPAGHSTEISSSVEGLCVSTACPPPPAAPYPATPKMRKPKSGMKSFLLQHYHSTGCAGGAFSWRAAMMDPEKSLFMCTERREFQITTAADIQLSLDDKRRGGGPRVGPFQENIPGPHWEALPKYDWTTLRRSCAFNERMHVEWENHVDHILANDGNLPVASVVAKAGFRSCAPCCRDMLALAKPTGKTFIMVDLAEDDQRGTFHFVCGDKYLPVPKEGLEPGQVSKLKAIVTDAQSGMYRSSTAIFEAVSNLGVPVDERGQTLYLGDEALLPAGCAVHLKGTALLDVLHAEHFARLSAEYGASIIRDPQQLAKQIQAVRACRARATQMLFAAWSPQLPPNLQPLLQRYVTAAVSPLLPEDPAIYLRIKNSGVVPRQLSLNTVDVRSPSDNSTRRWRLDSHHIEGKCQEQLASKTLQFPVHNQEDDAASTIAPSTTATDDCASVLIDEED